MKRVPRKEDFLPCFAGGIFSKVEEREVEGCGLEERDDERVKVGRPGDPGPLSTSEGEVMAVDLVIGVVVVTTVPTVLVDCRFATDR